MKYQRLLQEKELAILNEQLDQLGIRFQKQVRFLIIWALLALAVGTFAYFKMDPKDHFLLAGTVVIYIGIGVWILVEDHLKRGKQRKSIAYLKEKNIVTVVEVKSNKYYELKEEDDEGDFYLFQLDDNHVFSFGGQSFYSDEQFPSDHFEIVEGHGLNNEILILEAFNYGKRLQPLQVISGQEKWDMLGSAKYPDPEKLTVVEGQLEQYLFAVK